ncbi:MAG: hypothetical protein HN889_12515 [Rhodospirillaceae bacterium]|mgnify:CR=1 FL=1|jgi:CxxC motif-containing protein (DUF1111 family)|nr:hypothetical protein [Rhodospirillaceae bacterium]MBT5561520.1 hypothetical protein [Rhodospirillaceae bacterium]MBT6241882.1 hypothetical protein [Rhodospirillaceae bacterium]MBT7138683.1 hypothetical protein [Rhodospirillaceae bacterium]
MKHLLSILALFAIIISSGAEAATPARYSTDGDLMLPENWREWVFIGSPTSPDSMNSGEAYQPGFKYVYIDPESFAHWKKTGTFRNGTMIVQERLKVVEAEYMDNHALIPGDYIGLSAMVKDSKRYPDSIWGFFSFGRPPYGEQVPEIGSMDNLGCSGCHYEADQDWVFTRFYPVLLAAKPVFTANAPASGGSPGKDLYGKEWVAAKRFADGEMAGDGLGPLFNARSCDACHPDGSRGKFEFWADGTIKGDSLLLKVGAGKYGDPIYGGQIQPRAVSGIEGEGQPAVRFEKIRDPSGTMLRKPVFELRDPAYGPLSEKSLIAGRVSPALHGFGDLEKVSEQTLIALSDPEDKNGDGISGRINRVTLFDGSTALGRFGWKAAQWSLEVQTGKAFRMDMGMSSKIMGPAWGDCTPRQKACYSAAHGERPRNDGREISNNVIKLVTDSVLDLVPTPPRGADPEGKQVFRQIGCAACHIPEVPLDDGGTSRMYTDLLLHDTGPGLADGFVEGSAGSGEWRTAPLMGLGWLMKKKEFLLHDGRARDVREAILWHGGEAAGAAQAYRDLENSQRYSLHRFLGTL